MRLVVQRVNSSSVYIKSDEGKRLSGSINKGYMVLVGITHDDTVDDVEYCAKKLVGLRVFEDENEKMNLSIGDVNGEILLVSQFTLYGDGRKGNRPSFIEAARPEVAIPLYEMLISKLRESDINVETGEFGADMDVEISNDGPVTILFDSKKNF